MDTKDAEKGNEGAPLLYIIEDMRLDNHKEWGSRLLSKALRDPYLLKQLQQKYNLTDEDLKSAAAQLTISSKRIVNVV